MNKYFGIVLAILSTMVVSLSTTFAMLSESKMEVLETAANKIVTILEKEDISMESFMMILDKVESNIQGQETKLMVLDVLKELTLDIYYKVDDFSECISYYDGCNTCGVEEGVVTFCTEMACTQMSTPSCEQYAGQDAVTDQEIGCNEAGGQFNSLYNECEDIDELVCNSLSGTFNECASACRHEAEGSICTMQCVVICDFNGEGEADALLEAQMDLDAAISRWNAERPGSYTLTQQLSCFCTPEYTRPISYMIWSEVINSDAVYADEDQEMVDPDNSPELLTIDSAFTLIQEAIDQEAASITVEYNETLGYPMSISIDYNAMIADEEAYYTFIVE